MQSSARYAKNSSRLLPRTLLAVIVTTVLIVPNEVSASSGITNGTFETDAVGSTVTGWEKLEQRIDLGVSTIAGCLTSDTSNYAALRDYDAEWVSEYGTTPSPPVSRDPAVNNDSLDITWRAGRETYQVSVVDSTALGGGLSRAGQSLRLRSDLSRVSGEESGYVVHGPVVVSSAFSAKTIDDLSFSWAASAEGDDYKAFGYLLNTATCAQTEVIDSTGRSANWQNVSVAIPANGTYRFVFVGGTFDQSFGGVAGGILYIDDVQLVVNEVRAAEEQRNSSPASPKIPNINEFEAGNVLVTPGTVQTLTGSRMHCTTYVNINSQAVSFSYSVLPQGLGQWSIAIPAGLKPGPQVMSIDSCGGPVTYLSKLIVAKPPIMLEGRFSTGMEQGLKAREIISWAKANRADYNSVKCISNTKVESQERARQFANDICKQILGVLASPKSTEVEIRDKATHISVWFRIFLSNT